MERARRPYSRTDRFGPDEVRRCAVGRSVPPDLSKMMPGAMGRNNMMQSWMNEEMPMMGPMRGHMMKIMFAVVDTDGDGAISFDEMIKIHKRIFTAVDANHDGKITPDELRTFLQDRWSQAAGPGSGDLAPLPC